MHGLALAVTAVVVVGILVALLAANRHGHLLAAALPTLLLLAIAWAIAKVAQDADYRDADGWVDCWPSCSRVQHAVGVSLWIGPLVGLLIVAVVVVATVIRRTRAT
jgi:hypothetical protein